MQRSCDEGLSARRKVCLRLAAGKSPGNRPLATRRDRIFDLLIRWAVKLTPLLRNSFSSTIKLIYVAFGFDGQAITDRVHLGRAAELKAPPARETAKAI